jgi:hypothetical protein
VVDSVNDNNLRAFMDPTVDAAPTYVSTVPPKPLRSGLPNTLALDFVPNEDVYANEQAINNGIIAPGGGFTVEAAFMTNNPARFAGIVGKEGRPGEGSANFFRDKIQTFVLKTRGDNSLLQVELFDAAANEVQVSSQAPLLPGQWYYAAVVNDGSMLSLWLDSGTGYELQGSAPVAGALFQGRLDGDYNANGIVDAADFVAWRDNLGQSVMLPNDPTAEAVTSADFEVWKTNFGRSADWDRQWTIGRGEFEGTPADFFDGIIDEVRITNMPLEPSQFLFAPPGGSGLAAAVPEPATALLSLLAVAAFASRRFTQRSRK